MLERWIDFKMNEPIKPRIACEFELPKVQSSASWNSDTHYLDGTARFYASNRRDRLTLHSILLDDSSEWVSLDRIAWLVRIFLSARISRPPTRREVGNLE